MNRQLKESQKERRIKRHRDSEKGRQSDKKTNRQRTYRNTPRETAR